MVQLAPHTALLAALLAAAASSDAVTHRVPNALSVALAVAGLASRAMFGGWEAFMSGVAAAGLVGAIAFPFWLAGRVGGGDLKLAVAAAIWVGIAQTPAYLAATAMAGGLLAAICYVRSSSDARMNIRTNLLRWHAAPWAKPNGVTGTVVVPYGVAIAAGTIFAVCR